MHGAVQQLRNTVERLTAAGSLFILLYVDYCTLCSRKYNNRGEKVYHDVSKLRERKCND